MDGQAFKKYERLLKWSEFQNVLNCGRKKKVDSVFTLFWINNGMMYRRIGIIASKKTGKAVMRNRIKRRIREVFRRNKEKIRPALDIVLIGGKGMDELPFSLLENKIMEILRA